LFSAFIRAANAYGQKRNGDTPQAAKDAPE
jgi:hypothetical protein